MEHRSIGAALDHLKISKIIDADALARSRAGGDAGVQIDIKIAFESRIAQLVDARTAIKIIVGAISGRKYSVVASAAE